MSSTRGKHSSAWRAWRSFCRYAKVARTCYTEGVLVLFVAWLRSVRKVALGTAKAYLFGVSMFFKLLGETATLTDFPRVALSLDGYKRLSPAAQRKEKFRITTSLLQRLQQHVKKSPREQVLWALAVTATQGLFRLGELAPTKGPPLSWRAFRTCAERAAAIFLADSMADYMRQGVEVMLADLPGQLCAPPLLRALRAKAGPDDAMFSLDGRAATKVDVTGFMSSLLSRTAGIRMTGGVKGHSFRQGGAQSLFDAGISIEDIKIFGRWKSDAFRLYIQMSIERIVACHARMASAAPSAARWEL